MTDLLPFHLDDSELVNQAFVRWRQSQSAGDKRLVDTWTYCYVYRYFLIKLVSSASQKALTLDWLVANAFDDVQGSLRDIRRPECYTHWVSKICRNTFVNHLRTQRSLVSLDLGGLLLVDEDVSATEARDASVIYRSIRAAIEALPDYLREVARMRLLENRSYGAIREETGKSLKTLRSYVNKALIRLRRNPRLLLLLEEMHDG
ncbi:MAG: sigma-70 family RNA polymerase sigma factor [Bacteroidetes bacterium]|nr:sigma-70 family RNA polymerase sigma factor [Bacteroidota bacterium]